MSSPMTGILSLIASPCYSLLLKVRVVFSVSPSPFGLDFGTSDSGLTIRFGLDL